MYTSDELDIWNLTPGGTARSGAVDIFNVTGVLHTPSEVDRFVYELNGSSPTPVYFTRQRDEDGRLRRPGAFNIDTISLSDLQRRNHLRFRIVKTDGRTVTHDIPFGVAPFQEDERRFTLTLDGVDTAEQVGQIVDGRWLVQKNEHGRSYLEITPEDAGYDRIILFGHRKWTTGYEVIGRLSITEFQGAHNLGLVYKWNPHERGDGTWLPTQWSSGLGYYSSYGPHDGLVIRYGVDADIGENGERRGSYVLDSEPLSARRRFFNRIGRRLGLVSHLYELRLKRDYWFRLQVHPEQYALTVWLADEPEPSPQITVNQPQEMLDQGPVGLLASQIAVRLYELRVRPVSEEVRSP